MRVISLLQMTNLMKVIEHARHNATEPDHYLLSSGAHVLAQQMMTTAEYRQIVTECGHAQVGVDLALEADAYAVAWKSQQLGALFQRLMGPLCTAWSFRLASPESPHRRGSQVCYAHPDGYAIVQVPPPFLRAVPEGGKPMRNNCACMHAVMTKTQECCWRLAGNGVWNPHGAGAHC